jgi:hypothetical protein
VRERQRDREIGTESRCPESLSLTSSLLRFLDITLSAQHNITTGKIYREVIERERRGDYLGKTVQIVPHATDLIISWIKEVAQRPVDGTTHTPDVCLIEVRSLPEINLIDDLSHRWEEQSATSRA